MALMDIFRGFSGAPATPSPATPAQGTQQLAASAVANTTVPTGADGVPPNNITALPANMDDNNKSPLASYDDLFITKAGDKQPSSMAPELLIDPNAVATAVAKIDFTKVLDPAVLDKASKGDAASLAQIINQTAQVSLTQAMTATGNIVKAALDKQSENFHSKVMPDILRKHSISQGMGESQALYNNPAIQPIFKAVEDRLSARFPTAPAEEITKHAHIFFDNMASEILKSRGYEIKEAPSKSALGVPTNTFTSPKDTDWDNWFK